ncbi:hypothetical protein ACHAWT_005689 [Skeletonema menzelii]
MLPYKSFIIFLTLASCNAYHDVKEKYRLFQPPRQEQHRIKRIGGWKDSTAEDVDVNVDVTIDCNEGGVWGWNDSKSGKTKSGKCEDSKSGKSKTKSGKSKSAKVETLWPTYSPSHSSIVSPDPTSTPPIATPKPTERPTTMKPTKRPKTMRPTPTPTSPSPSPEPTPETSSRPTKASCTPLDPNPYSFEPPNNVFPKAPWTTGGDGKWAIDDTSSHTGRYSIKSPNFFGSPGLKESNATLTVCDDFEGGPLTFRVLSSVLPPQDNFVIYVDLLEAAQITDVQEYEEIQLELSSGPHRVDFIYRYNVFSLDPLPAVPPEILGAVWLDSVALGNVLPGSQSPTQPPATEAPIVAPTSKAPSISEAPVVAPTSKAPSVSGAPVATASPTPLMPSSYEPTVSLQPTSNATQPITTSASPTIQVTTANPATTISPNTSPTPPPSNVPTTSGGSSPTPLPTKLPTPQPNDTPTPPTPTPPPTKLPTPQPNSLSPPPTKLPTPQPNSLPPPPTPPPTKLPTPQPNSTPPPTPPPTPIPTTEPIPSPTQSPTRNPTIQPSPLPTPNPTQSPTKNPTVKPTPPPSPGATNVPSITPSSFMPTAFPTYTPTDPV